LTRPILKAINDLGYSRPTPIQQLAIPIISSGKDIVASSITGSGKTAAFLIPIIQRYFNVAAVGFIRAMIVTPTRELAIQIF
jgi:superfamily II DNA/RNA helicase